MASPIETILSILEIVFGLFLYFGLPTLVFFTCFGVAVIVVTRIGSSLLTLVLVRFPTVARPLNHLTAKFTDSSRENFERDRLAVVGCLSVAYAVVYILSAWTVFAIYEVIGRVIYGTRPGWYLMVTEYSYPFLAVLLGLPFILVIHTYRESWRDTASRSRTAFEWGIVLLALNVLVPVGLYAAVFGSIYLSKWLMMGFWGLVEAIGRSVQQGM